jgi:hypothetical protein
MHQALAEDGMQHALMCSCKHSEQACTPQCCNQMLSACATLSPASLESRDT